MPAMKWLDTPWFYVYVAVASGVLGAIVTAIGGDGVDWPQVALITVAILVGTFIGRQIKARRDEH